MSSVDSEVADTSFVVHGHAKVAGFIHLFLVLFAEIAAMEECIACR